MPCVMRHIPVTTTFPPARQRNPDRQQIVLYLQTLISMPLLGNVLIEGCCVQI